MIEAWTEALKEDRRRARRIAKGLSPVAPTHADRQREYVKRKADAKATLLTYSWFSPELSETPAREQIAKTHPELDDITVHYQYGHLAALCKQWHLNVNNFTIAQMGQDGVEKANHSRAIFDYIQTRTNNTDYIAVLKAADFVTDFAGLVGDTNAQTKAIVAAGERWGNGARILDAARRAK